ncbi:hypothetical protein A9Q99_03230 [Gammaproteobacteria bacterium 45_16_T64]|nr:hypothetical protein A9Q99_03230 [Gammaproteobacteria bacterium 45_16_T64]
MVNIESSGHQIGVPDEFSKVAVVLTGRSAHYLSRLCKHFSHKVPANWDDTQGKVLFAMGSCLMSATDTELHVRCIASNIDDLGEILDTMKGHFDRFASKDQLILQWQ